MIREQLLQHDIGRDVKFRWRGHEISRIEGLSDGVFAFAITLLVVLVSCSQNFVNSARSSIRPPYGVLAYLGS